MKKFLLTIILLFAAATTFSQTKFGLKGGINFANMKLEGGDIDPFEQSPASRISFHLGGFSEISLGSTFVFQPALMISGKGYKIDYSASEGGYNTSVDAKLQLLYLELPLNVLAKFSARTGKFLLGTGPYLAYGVEGKLKGRLEVDGPGTQEDVSMPLNSDIEFGNAQDEYEPFDFGVNLIAGYEFKTGLSLNLNYGLGFANVSNTSGLHSQKHKVISVSAGFKF